MRSRLILFLTVIAALYAVALLVLYFDQRRMMYFPASGSETAEASGLKSAETLKLTTADHETIVAWYQAAAPGHPIFLYFHGNGGHLADRVDWLRRLSNDGSGFFAIDYRGYGGSTGTPTEAGLLIDGAAAYSKVTALGYAPDRIVILGESIGTGVAVAVASEHPCAALVLDSAFSATADVAAARYWMFPINLLMMDTFMSRERIAHVTAPKLFFHGSQDDIIPIAFDRVLFDAASQPKTFIEIPDGGHVVMWRQGVLDQMKSWLAQRDPSPAGSLKGPSADR